MKAEQRGFFEALVGDGRPLLTWTGLALIFSGGFALFLSVVGQFLPHDVQFLGSPSAEALFSVADGRLAAFMFHDRVAFGGSIIAIGLLYLWLVEFPLGNGESWAWWTLLLTGVLGFGSFLSYLGYGYLDTWHGTGSLALLLLYGCGLWRTRHWRRAGGGERRSWKRGSAAPWRSRRGLGLLLLLASGVGMVLAGGTILVVGMTTVFVPQDLAFMGVTPAELDAVNPRLIPLIAHDRAGFGGGICTAGLALFLIVWFGRPMRSLWQVLGLVGLFGFGTAIGVHFAIGYTDLLHLTPAYMGFLWYFTGLTLAATGRS